MIFYVKITGFSIKQKKDVSKTIAVQVQGYDYNTAADVALFEAQSMNLADVVVDTVKATKIQAVHPHEHAGNWYLIAFDNGEDQWVELFQAADMKWLQDSLRDWGCDISSITSIKREKIAAYVAAETYEHDAQYKQAMHQWHIKKTFAKAEQYGLSIEKIN